MIIGKLILPGVWKKEMQQTFLIIVTNLISKIRKTCIMPNLFIGSYFGISVLYIELKWNNWYTRYDQYLILFQKQWTLLVYVYSEIQHELLPVIERTITHKIICLQDVKKKNVAIFIIAIWQDVSFECQKFISSLFIALNWIFAFFYIEE